MHMKYSAKGSMRFGQTYEFSDLPLNDESEALAKTTKILDEFLDIQDPVVKKFLNLEISDVQIDDGAIYSAEQKESGDWNIVMRANFDISFDIQSNYQDRIMIENEIMNLLNRHIGIGSNDLREMITCREITSDSVAINECDFKKLKNERAYEI